MLGSGLEEFDVLVESTLERENTNSDWGFG